MSPPSRRLGLIELFEAFAGHLLCCLEMASKLLFIDGGWAAGTAYHSHVPQGAKLTPEKRPRAFWSLAGVPCAHVCFDPKAWPPLLPIHAKCRIFTLVTRRPATLSTVCSVHWMLVAWQETRVGMRVADAACRHARQEVGGRRRTAPTYLLKQA
eukprot:scaffold2825_cov111-Isochrysis_galbana.AAC.9